MQPRIVEDGWRYPLSLAEIQRLVLRAILLASVATKAGVRVKWGRAEVAAVATSEPGRLCWASNKTARQ